MSQSQWVREMEPPIHRRLDPVAARVVEWVKWMNLDGRPLHITPVPGEWPPARRRAVEQAVFPKQIVWEDQPPPTPTPGELLAASMPTLPALPPTAGGLCSPARV